MKVSLNGIFLIFFAFLLLMGVAQTIPHGISMLIVKIISGVVITAGSVFLVFLLLNLKNK